MSKKIAGRRRRDRPRRQGRRRRLHEDARGRPRARPRAMIELGRSAGRETMCVLTDMDQPLGCAVGNALEMREAAETVRGDGPRDFAELVLDSVAHLLALSDLGIDEEEGRRRAEEAVDERRRVRRVRARGSAPSTAIRTSIGCRSRLSCSRWPLRATEFVASLGAIRIGLAALHLGAGRRTKEDAIDHAVGVVCLKKRGDAVRKRASRSPSARPRRARCRGRGCRRARRVRARGRCSAATADRARGPRLACPSFPRSRPSGPSWRLSSPAGRSYRSRSSTSGSRVRSILARGRSSTRGRARRRPSIDGGSMWLSGSSSDLVLLVHLRMTGSFLIARRWGAAADPHRRAVVRLDDGSDVAYRDVRRFGTWLVLEADELSRLSRRAAR